MKKATIIDVARLAGVSTATVSRAMHTSGLVRPETLGRVLSAMRECGYVYNAVAGDFSRCKSTVVGVLILSTTTKVADTLSAAGAVAAERQFPLIVGASGFDPELERGHLQHFLQRGVAGVLVIGHLRENLPTLEQLQERGIPCVFLWDTLPGSEKNYVGFDNVQGSYAMTDNLIRQGHTRIGFLCGYQCGVARIAKRYEGYRRALSENGLPFDESLVHSTVSTFANGKAAMQKLMAMPDPPRCIFCASDVLGMGAIAAVHEAGLCVPHDFSIAGFDNSDFSAYTCPPLSTVNVPGYEMGLLGMQALLKRIEDNSLPPIQKELPTTLVLRASSCPAARQYV